MAKRSGTVLLGGGRGFIGSAVKSVLLQNGYDVIVVSRHPGPGLMTWTDIESNGLPKCEAVINVAGNRILDPRKRWTLEFRNEVRQSRWDTTKTFARAIDAAEHRPKVFATMSGVGFYETSDTIVYDESKYGGDFDFFSRIVCDWEEASRLYDDDADESVRQVIIRTGAVLGREGGIVSQLIRPFSMGLGGKIGSGRQYMPWIHVHDLARLFVHVIDDRTPLLPTSPLYPTRMKLNGVAPQLITNAQFTKAFARALRRPALLRMPVFMFNLVFGPDRAKIVTGSLKVIPKQTLNTGFRFQYPDIDSACAEVTKIKPADEKNA